MIRVYTSLSLFLVGALAAREGRYGEASHETPGAPKHRRTSAFLKLLNSFGKYDSQYYYKYYNQPEIRDQLYKHRIDLKVLKSQVYRSFFSFEQKTYNSNELECVYESDSRKIKGWFADAEQNGKMIGPNVGELIDNCVDFEAFQDAFLDNYGAGEVDILYENKCFKKFFCPGEVEAHSDKAELTIGFAYKESIHTGRKFGTEKGSRFVYAIDFDRTSQDDLNITIELYCFEDNPIKNNKMNTEGGSKVMTLRLTTKIKTYLRAMEIDAPKINWKATIIDESDDQYEPLNRDEHSVFRTEITCAINFLREDSAYYSYEYKNDEVYGDF